MSEVNRRTADEMMAILRAFADDPRIQVATLEGSRTNPNIPDDAWKDYDVSYFVTDMPSFTNDPAWLNHFGHVVMLQTPESMELFPPSMAGESYLMICDDLTKIDLTLYPIEYLETYFAEEDKLKEVLVDKDGRIPYPVIGTDEEYHLKRPTLGEYTDCLNEFWFVSNYVVKGLCRGEFLFATHHFTQIMQHEAFRMIAWEVGEAHGYGFSIGKNFKFMQQFVSPECWQEIQATFRMDGETELLKSYERLCALMRTHAKALGAVLGYPYPPFDDAVSEVNQRMLKIAGLTDHL